MISPYNFCVYKMITTTKKAVFMLWAVDKKKYHCFSKTNVVIELWSILFYMFDIVSNKIYSSLKWKSFSNT